MAPASRSQNNEKQKEKTDSVGSSTKAKNDTKRSTNRKKTQSLSQPTPVNIIHYKMYNEWFSLV